MKKNRTESPIPTYEGSMVSLKETYKSASAYSRKIIEKPKPDFINWKGGPLENHYKCVYCNKHLKDPVSLQCDHYMCLNCFIEMKKYSLTCPDCEVEIIEKDLQIDKELRNEIINFGVYCTYSDNGCNWEGKLKDLEMHLDKCGYVSIECSKGCGITYLRKNREDHLDECTESVVECEFCKLHISKKDEVEHLHKCPEFRMTCPNGCGRNEIKRAEITNHLENQCTKHKIKCPFAESGCSFTALRTEMGAHMKESPGLHLNLMNKTITTQKQKMQTLADIIDEQNNKLAKLHAKVNSFEKFCGAAFVWRIDDYSLKLEESKSGKKPSIFSAPFLTSRHGYKLVLTSSLYGEGKAKGKFMSLYVCICKGDYDALLTWPFNHKITLTLLDQPGDKSGQQRHVDYLVKPNTCKENLAFLGRPIADRNAPFGVQKFVELEALETQNYIVDDAMYIKVDIDYENMDLI